MGVPSREELRSCLSIAQKKNCSALSTTGTNTLCSYPFGSVASRAVKSEQVHHWFAPGVSVWLPMLIKLFQSLQVVWNFLTYLVKPYDQTLAQGKNPSNCPNKNTHTHGQVCPSAAVTRQLTVSPWLSEEARDGWAETCGLTRKHFATLPSSTRHSEILGKNHTKSMHTFAACLFGNFTAQGRQAEWRGTPVRHSLYGVWKNVCQLKVAETAWDLWEIYLDLWPNQRSEFEFQLQTTQSRVVFRTQARIKVGPRAVATHEPFAQKKTKSGQKCDIFWEPVEQFLQICWDYESTRNDWKYLQENYGSNSTMILGALGCIVLLLHYICRHHKGKTHAFRYCSDLPRLAVLLEKTFQTVLAQGPWFPWRVTGPHSHECTTKFLQWRKPKPFAHSFTHAHAWILISNCNTGGSSHFQMT